MSLRLNSLGVMARAMLGIAHEQDSPAAVVVVQQGPAATAPEPEGANPGDPDHEENEMPGSIDEAAHAAAIDAATVAATDAATKAANDRWKTVLASDEAKGRTKLAVALLDGPMQAEAIVAALAEAPVAAAEAPKAAFSPSLGARMEGETNPNIGAGDGGGKSELATTWLGDRRNASAKKGN